MVEVKDANDSFSGDFTAERTSSDSFAKRSLSIVIPEDDQYADKNPNFKTPMDAQDAQEAAKQIVNSREGSIGPYDDDAESEKMVMMPSDSVSSMSEMMRMDSNAELSQTSSFKTLQQSGSNDSRKPASAMAAAAAPLQNVNFTEIDEDDNESDDHSQVLISPQSSKFLHV